MNWLDIVICICLLVGIIKGLFDGLVKQLISLIALFLAIVFSGTIAGIIRNFVDTHFHWEFTLSTGVINAIYFVIAFIVIISLFALLAHLVDKLISYTPVGALNKLAGAAFGLVLWLLCLSFLLNILFVFDTKSKIISKETQEKSVTYEYIKDTLPAVYPHIKEFFQH
jgi:membrane protein required for colicin V production